MDLIGYGRTGRPRQWYKAQIGGLVFLEVCPDRTDRIEFRGIRRQARNGDVSMQFFTPGITQLPPVASPQFARNLPLRPAQCQQLRALEPTLLQRLEIPLCASSSHLQTNTSRLTPLHSMALTVIYTILNNCPRQSIIATILMSIDVFCITSVAFPKNLVQRLIKSLSLDGAGDPSRGKYPQSAIWVICSQHLLYIKLQ